MNAKAKTPVAAAAVATAGEVADSNVVKTLQEANKLAASAQGKSRAAALAAWETSAYLGSPTRAADLQRLYSRELANDVVKQAFSNALVILQAGQPVRVAFTAMTETPKTGAVSFTAGDVLAVGEVPDPEKAVRTFKPEEAIAAFTKADLTAAAKAAREFLGTARKAGGGRKASTPTTAGGRAPFADELRALMADVAGRKMIAGILQDCGFTMVAAKADTATRVLCPA